MPRDFGEQPTPQPKDSPFGEVMLTEGDIKRAISLSDLQEDTLSYPDETKIELINALKTAQRALDGFEL